MKKTLKVLLAVVITPIALFLILTLLLYCPPVQKWAVDRAAQVASEKTGMRILVENRMKILLEYYDIADLSNVSGG